MLRKIYDFQLRELEEDKLYINIYDLSVKYNYEFAIYLKEFYFDVLEALIRKEGSMVCEGNGLSHNIKDYLKLIKKYRLNIDIKDYPEMCDYVLYKEWKQNPDNGIAYFPDGIYLVSKDINGEI